MSLKFLLRLWKIERFEIAIKENPVKQRKQESKVLNPILSWKAAPHIERRFYWTRVNANRSKTQSITIPIAEISASSLRASSLVILPSDKGCASSRVSSVPASPDLLWLINVYLQIVGPELSPFSGFSGRMRDARRLCSQQSSTTVGIYNRKFPAEKFFFYFFFFQRSLRNHWMQRSKVGDKPSKVSSFLKLYLGLASMDN